MKIIKMSFCLVFVVFLVSCGEVEKKYLECTKTDTILNMEYSYNVKAFFSNDRVNKVEVTGKITDSETDGDEIYDFYDETYDYLKSYEGVEYTLLKTDTGVNYTMIYDLIKMDSENFHESLVHGMKRDYSLEEFEYLYETYDYKCN